MTTDRQGAICELLTQPDPPDLRRNSVPRCDGDPARFARYADLPMRYTVIARLLRDGGETR